MYTVSSRVQSSERAGQWAHTLLDRREAAVRLHERNAHVLRIRVPEYELRVHLNPVACMFCLIVFKCISYSLVQHQMKQAVLSEFCYHLHIICESNEPDILLGSLV